MSKEKKLFGGLFSQKKKNEGCCNFEIIEESECCTQPADESSCCCGTAEENCCSCCESSTQKEEK